MEGGTRQGVRACGLCAAVSVSVIFVCSGDGWMDGWDGMGLDPTPPVYCLWVLKDDAPPHRSIPLLLFSNSASITTTDHHHQPSTKSRLWP
jgi:hypothetical protein